VPKRTAATRWEGSLMEGNGTMRFGSGAFEGPFSFRSRFEAGDGTNPEELIAAAHAGCFSMMLLAGLARAGHDPESVETDATVRLEQRDGNFAITRIELTSRARVPGIDSDELQRIANEAKVTCPVSRALAGVHWVELDAQLVE
jgi:lipoyl-dependent peroxiredoxin